MERTVLYVSDPDDAILLVEAHSFYVTSQTKTATFYSPSIYRAARTEFVELHEFYHNYATDMYPTFISPKTVRSPDLSGQSWSVKHLFQTNMLLLKYDPPGNKKWWAGRAMQQLKWLTSCVKNLFTIEYDQQRTKPKLKGITEVSKGVGCCATKMGQSPKLRKSFWVSVSNKMNAWKQKVIKHDWKRGMIMAYGKEALRTMTTSHKVMLMM